MTRNNAGQRLEAATGIEPVYRALQALAYHALTCGFVAQQTGRDHIVTMQEAPHA